VNDVFIDLYVEMRALISKIKSPAFFPIHAAVPGIAFVILLSGCAAMRVRLGMRVSLPKTPVASIKANLPNGPGIAPGENSPLVVVVTEPNGKNLQTEGKGDGKVLWSDLKVTGELVSVNQKGVLSLPSDPRISDGKVGHVTVTVPSHPGVTTDLDIPVRYNYKFLFDCSGGRGASGFSGTDGMNGSDGSTGSTDPNNPSPGGNGTNGTDGSDGGDGGPGSDAPPVQVQVTLRLVDRPLLQAAVSAGGVEKFFLIDPQGGSLAVVANGGRGGFGGSGGRGGRGGAGGNGTPSGMSGSNGMDGRSGSDGPPGKGGLITVTYDPQAKPYLGIIHLSSENGPPVVLKEEYVAPLW
jgi:hypothetical protein